MAGLAAVGMSTVTEVLAQVAPDAGTLLQQQPKPKLIPQPSLRPTPVEKPEVVKPDSGPKVLVKEIRVKGSTIIPESELVALLADRIGKESSFSELQAAARQLIRAFLQKGYIARVILPPQDLKDGVVEYQVIEATRGNVKVTASGERIDTARVSRFVDERLPAGALFNARALGEALNILSEQPGIDARSQLLRGKDETAADVVITVAEKPLVSYSLDVNNHSSRGSGVLQATGSVQFSNPTGRFDSGSLLLNASEGSVYARGDYSIAVGDRGLRLGVNFAHLDYRIVQESLRALGSKGTADIWGLNASYPLSKLDALNLTLTGALEQKRLVDETVAGETGNREVTTLQAGLSGYSLVRNVGVFSFGANWVTGDSNQRNAAALAADQASRRTNGSFDKLAWNLAMLQPMGDGMTALATLRGQFARKNLDSSERLLLGGPRGVRAYPAGEAQGDEGWLLNLELQKRLNEQFTLAGFIDSGEVTVNRDIPAAGLATPNRYSLTGAGLSLDWRLRSRALLRSMLAAPIGNNPGRDAAGNNNDGRNNQVRLWVSLAMQF